MGRRDRRGVRGPRRHGGDGAGAAGGAGDARRSMRSRPMSSAGSGGIARVDFDRTFFEATKDVGVPAWRLGAGANMAFRRDAFDRVGLFDERLGAGASGCSEDSELWYRLLAEGHRCRYWPSAVVLHHHRADWDEPAAADVQLHARARRGALRAVRALWALGQHLSRIRRAARGISRGWRSAPASAGSRVCSTIRRTGRSAAGRAAGPRGDRRLRLLPAPSRPAVERARPCSARTPRCRCDERRDGPSVEAATGGVPREESLRRADDVRVLLSREDARDSPDRPGRRRSSGSWRSAAGAAA